MLENSSEAENATSAHLRNVEIIRVRGFSQSLILTLLHLNQTLRTFKTNYYKPLAKLSAASRQAYLQQTELNPENSPSSCVSLNEDNMSEFGRIIDDLDKLVLNFDSQRQMICLGHLSESQSKVDILTWVKEDAESSRILSSTTLS